MRIFKKEVCTLKTDTPTLTDKWHCGCIKCVEDLTKAGWATSKNTTHGFKEGK